jgi:hypothetical protein
MRSAGGRRAPIRSAVGGGAIAWEKTVYPAATIAAGLGVSVWLVYLDYRRRIPRDRGLTPSSRGSGLLNAGLTLAAGGVLLRLIGGTERGWTAALSYLAGLGGVALVIFHVTGRIESGFRDDPEGRNRKGRGGE